MQLNIGDASLLKKRQSLNLPTARDEQHDSDSEGEKFSEKFVARTATDIIEGAR
jgi:hypothetical protein